MWRTLAKNNIPPPKISFGEKPDLPDFMRDFVLAQYLPKNGNHKIVFYPPNWPENYLEKTETFRKEFIKTLSHEIGHAILYNFPWRSLDAFIHTKIALNLRLSFFFMVVTALAVFISIMVYVPKFISPWISVIFGIILWASLILMNLTVPTYLFYKKEYLTDIRGKKILSENKEIFDEMIKISKI